MAGKFGADIGIGEEEAPWEDHTYYEDVNMPPLMEVAHVRLWWGAEKGVSL